MIQTGKDSPINTFVKENNEITFFLRVKIAVYMSKHVATTFF